MAGVLTTYRQPAIFSRAIGTCLLLGCLVACDSPESVVHKPLPLPEREESAYITDQVYVAGNSLSLWNHDGGCQLQVSSEHKNAKADKQKLKPMAPCYFIKSPGSQKAQVFQQDKVTRILGILGTAVQQKQNSTKRCGKEIQGLLINHHGKVRLSDRVLSGSIYCAESGLDNFQYSLFHGS